MLSKSSSKASSSGDAFEINGSTKNLFSDLRAEQKPPESKGGSESFLRPKLRDTGGAFFLETPPQPNTAAPPQTPKQIEMLLMPSPQFKLPPKKSFISSKNSTTTKQDNQSEIDESFTKLSTFSKKKSKVFFQPSLATAAKAARMQAQVVGPVSNAKSGTTHRTSSMGRSTESLLPPPEPPRRKKTMKIGLPQKKMAFSSLSSLHATRRKKLELESKMVPFPAVASKVESSHKSLNQYIQDYKEFDHGKQQILHDLPIPTTYQSQNNLHKVSRNRCVIS